MGYVVSYCCVRSYCGYSLVCVCWMYNGVLIYGMYCGCNVVSIVMDRYVGMLTCSVMLWSYVCVDVCGSMMSMLG